MQLLTLICLFLSCLLSLLQIVISFSKSPWHWSTLSILSLFSLLFSLLSLLNNEKSLSLFSQKRKKKNMIWILSRTLCKFILGSFQLKAIKISNCVSAGIQMLIFDRIFDGFWRIGTGMNFDNQFCLFLIFVIYNKLLTYKVLPNTWCGFRLRKGSKLWTHVFNIHHLNLKETFYQTWSYMDVTYIV